MWVLVQDHDRFYTSPCGNVGFGANLNADLEVLRSRYGVVECLDEGTRVLVIIRNLPLPPHWNRNSTDVLVQTPQGYPMAAMDMFWVTPGLRLSDGRIPQSGDQVETFAGCAWQRFSWHYGPGNGWNPGVDSLVTHVRFARTRLAQAA
jgi:Prokaryotic E2 family E